MDSGREIVAIDETVADNPRPYPRLTLVANLRVGSTPVTAITRLWNPGDAARCRRCPTGRCSAHKDACQVLVGERVEPKEAPDYMAGDAGWSSHGTFPLNGDGAGLGGG